MNLKYLSEKQNSSYQQSSRQQRNCIFIAGILGERWRGPFEAIKADMGIIYVLLLGKMIKNLL